MNVQIPIAGLTLSNGQTYNGQLPVWATRPLMVKVTPDFISGNEYPVYVRVSNGGAIKKEISLPYQETVNLDLSFAALLLRRADRNKSEGDPAFPQQEVEIWSSDIANKITLPVFHCDETYWDTLGVDSALPQPPKPRIPGQTLDIYFPYRIHPLDVFQVEIEPVTGAPSSAIFPTTYVLGNTIDIMYIKKLTIKNVWGSGLDQVINYEDKLHTDVVYDESLQCALRARWNMRNGQWFWAAFKDYFWSNKFTPIRGRGGVTEQAEITINLEYGEEWYNVYQELLVSSNVVFELNIPGINQYQSKRFRAEVSGDTGARWSNSTKTYRQQVRFKTTELQDNYMFPLAPDRPPTPSIAFSAQHNPWLNNSASYMEGMWNNIYSNAAWEVQSTPSWMSVDNPTGNAGTTYLTATIAANTGEARTGNIVLKSLAGPTTYNIVVTQAKASIVFNPEPTIISAGANPSILLKQMNSNTPWECVEYPTWAVPINLTGAAGFSIQCIFNLQANTGAPRSANITYRSTVNPSVQNSFSVTQAGASGNISASPSTFNVDYVTLPVTANVTAVGAWSVSQRDTWITPSAPEGAPGETTVTLTIENNTSNDARTGTITFRDDLTGNIAVVTVNQTGAPTSIRMAPFRVSGPKAGGNQIVPAVVISENDWTMVSAPSWVSITPTSGEVGQTAIGVIYDTPNNTGAKRSGQLRLKNVTTNEIAIAIIEQEG